MAAQAPGAVLREALGLDAARDVELLRNTGVALHEKAAHLARARRNSDDFSVPAGYAEEFIRVGGLCAIEEALATAAAAVVKEHESFRVKRRALDQLVARLRASLEASRAKTAALEADNRLLRKEHTRNAIYVHESARQRGKNERLQAQLHQLSRDSGSRTQKAVQDNKALRARIATLEEELERSRSSQQETAMSLEASRKHIRHLQSDRKHLETRSTRAFLNECRQDVSWTVEIATQTELAREAPMEPAVVNQRFHGQQGRTTKRRGKTTRTRPLTAPPSKVPSLQGSEHRNAQFFARLCDSLGPPRPRRRPERVLSASAKSRRPMSAVPRVARTKGSLHVGSGLGLPKSSPELSLFEPDS